MSLIGNKSSERDVREWLTNNGFNGKTAKFTEVELHAIKRPGWLQIFRFHCHVLTEKDHMVQLFGAMHSDERFGKPKVVVSENLAVRDAQLVEWSRGLITLRQHRS